MNLVPAELRRFPHVREHNWLNHALIVDFLHDTAQRHARGVLVDIGCGVKPYTPVFAEHVDTHLGIDVPDSLHGQEGIDVIGSAYETNLADGACDTVLCTEVLEHLEDPRAAIREMHRILRPGGKVILTVPFFWPIHEAPRDYYRYSEYGLRYLFESERFEIVELRPLSGYVVTFMQLSIYFVRRFDRWLPLRVISRPLYWVMQHVALAANRHDRSFEFTNLYGLVARKQ